MCLILFPTLAKLLQFSRNILTEPPVVDFTKIWPAGAGLSHADTRTDSETDPWRNLLSPFQVLQTQPFVWVVRTSLSTTSRFTENCVHAECQRNGPTVTKLILLNYTRYAGQEQEFLQRIVTRDKTWVNHATPETKQAYIMWKHLSSPSTNKFKGKTSAKNIVAISFRDNKFVPFWVSLTVSLLYLLSVVVVRQAVCRKRPVFCFARCH